MDSKVKLHMIFLSKDRASQLDLAIRSMQRYNSVPNCKYTVLYAWTDSKFKEGYDILAQRYKDFNFVPETDFLLDYKKVLNTDCSYVVNIPDDCLFIHPFNYNAVFNTFINDPSIFALVLRLGKNIKNNYTDIHSPIPLPVFDHLNRYKWSIAELNWKYIFPICSNIYPMSKFKPVIDAINGKMNPNVLEDILIRIEPLEQEYMICFDHNIVIELCINRVNSTHPNPCGNISIEELNTKWLEGYRINLEALYPQIDYSSIRTRLINLTYEII